MNKENNNFYDIHDLSIGGAPVSAVPATLSTPAAPDTPRALRRSSRSRTRSPEPVTVKPVTQDPQLQAVSEEPEEPPQQQATAPAETSKPAESEQKDTEMYEKIIDEMDADDNNQQQDEIDEDALLEESNSNEQQKEDKPEQEDQNMETADGDEKEKEQQTTDEENRGVKRRSNSPAKGESPKKKQRLPPPNIDDFVNDEDEPELDENSLQLSWCK